MRCAKGNEGYGCACGAFDPAAIAGRRKEAIFGICVDRDEAGKSLRVAEHDAEVRERVVGPAAGHSENADIAIPLRSKKFECLFEIVMLLLGNANDLGAALLEIAQRFLRYGIKITNDGLARKPEAPRMFRTAIGTDDQPCALWCAFGEDALDEGAAKENESECVLAQGFFAFTCRMRRCGSVLIPVETTS